MDLESLMVRRQTALLARRVELIEALLEHSGLVDAVLGGGLPPFADPAPDDLGRAVGIDLGAIVGRRNPISDPAPDDLGRWAGSSGLLRELLKGWKIPRPGDPSPVDFGRFSKVQLESTLHSIAAEKSRLESMEGLVREQIKTLAKG